MSLKSFVQVEDVRARLRVDLIMPVLGPAREILAPPLTKNYSLVGTAFDYLLRFHLQRWNPEANTSDWIAQKIPPSEVCIDGERFFARAARPALAAFRIADDVCYGAPPPRPPASAGRGSFYSSPGQHLGHDIARSWP